MGYLDCRSQNQIRLTPASYSSGNQGLASNGKPTDIIGITILNMFQFNLQKVQGLCQTSLFMTK
jgi:hypothetical protein